MRQIYSVLTLLVMTFVLAAGEEAKPAASPAPTPTPKPVSPELLSDGSAIFRIYAPQATTVLIDGDWPPAKKTPLTKDEKGVWAVALKFPPELYQYRFIVDGAAVVDPNNRYVKAGRSPVSLIDVPGTEPRPFDRRSDAERGAVVTHSYFSKTLNVERRVRVYLPPGEISDRDKLPVLYLLHGSGDNEASWTTQGRADVIADNLLADGKMKKMLIVMPDGHAEEVSPWRDAESRHRAYERLEADLLKEIIPLVEKNYKVHSDSKDRAIIGLSMGGAQTAFIGLQNSDRFAWVGLFSPGGMIEDEKYTSALQNASKLNENLKWFWIGIGSSDGLTPRARAFSAKLTELGVHHEFHETEGSHSWILWRKYLNECLPQLFR